MARGRYDYTDYIDQNGLRYCVEATSDSQREWKIYTLAPGSRTVKPCELEVYGKPAGSYTFPMRMIAQDVLNYMAERAGDWKKVPV